jgi:flagellar biosynthesis regulator FlaF
MLSLNIQEQEQLLERLDDSPEQRKLVFEAAAELLAESIRTPGEAELKEALIFNQKVWNTFQSNLLGETIRLSLDAKKNLLALGAFVEHRTNELLVKPDPKRAKPLQKAAQSLACDPLEG